MQRIRLASQIGSGLTGVLYILDEPSIGLHARDNLKLIETLRRLRDIGNTVIVVEHDEDTMLASDYMVDFGPGPGVEGGKIVAQGTVADVLSASNKSLTARFLNGSETIPIPKERKKPNGSNLVISGRRPQPEEHRRRNSARLHDLCNRRQRKWQELADQRHPG